MKIEKVIHGIEAELRLYQQVQSALPLTPYCIRWSTARRLVYRPRTVNPAIRKHVRSCLRCRRRLFAAQRSINHPSDVALLAALDGATTSDAMLARHHLKHRRCSLCERRADRMIQRDLSGRMCPPTVSDPQPTSRLKFSAKGFPSLTKLANHLGDTRVRNLAYHPSTITPAENEHLTHCQSDCAQRLADARQIAQHPSYDHLQQFAAGHPSRDNDGYDPEAVDFHINVLRCERCRVQIGRPPR